MTSNVTDFAQLEGDTYVLHPQLHDQLTARGIAPQRVVIVATLKEFNERYVLTRLEEREKVANELMSGTFTGFEMKTLIEWELDAVFSPPDALELPPGNVGFPAAVWEAGYRGDVSDLVLSSVSVKRLPSEELYVAAEFETSAWFEVEVDADSHLGWDIDDERSIGQHSVYGSLPRKISGSITLTYDPATEAVTSIGIERLDVAVWRVEAASANSAEVGKRLREVPWAEWQAWELHDA